MRKLLVLLLAFAVVAPAMAADMNARGIAIRTDNAFRLPGQPDVPSSLHQGNLPGVCDAATNFCCEFLGDPTCDDAPGVYAGGTAACWSDYWSDSADGQYDVLWTHAWLIPSVIPIFIDEPIDFGVLAPGDYTFCVGFTFDPLPSPPSDVAIDTGFRTKADSGTAQAIAGSFTLTP